MTKAVSYTSRQPSGPVALLREARHLVRSYYGGSIDERVALAVERIREREREMERAAGAPLEGRRMLDVGAGQRLLQMAYFARRNEVVGIDLDVVVQGFDPRGYWRMLRTNGPKRTAKTLARKALLVDRRFHRGIARAAGLKRFPRLDVRQMDAADLRFPDASFDVVYSMSVFSHLPDPARVLAETARVLRPGGLAFHNFLLFTSRTGSMDLRLLGGGEGELPLWAHLRPQHRDSVQPSAYLNEVRLPDWRRLFEEAMPGAHVQLGQHERERLEPEAARLQAAGELTEYDLDELTTAEVTVVWTKPAGSSAAAR